MAKEYKDLVVGLDIGTSKIMVVVAEVQPSGQLKLAGFWYCREQWPEAWCCRQYRRYGAEYSGSAERSRVHGGLQDYAGVHGYHGQSYPWDQLQWHGGGEG